MDDTKTAGSRRVLLGRIGDAHGLKGAVLIKTFTAEPDGIAAYGPLENAAGTRRFEISVERVTPKGVIARVAGVSDRTQAEALKGVELFIGRDRLPEPEDGTYYHDDLIGLTAVGLEDEALGTVVAVANYGAGDILEIKPAAGERTQLVPLLEAYVASVDVAAGLIVLRLPDEVDAGDTPEPADQNSKD